MCFRHSDGRAIATQVANLQPKIGEQFCDSALIDSAEEIFWTLDAENLKVLFVNPAYETITGRSCESLEEDPKSYEEVIHPEDRVRVLSRLRESVHTGQLDEEFRIVR